MGNSVAVLRAVADAPIALVVADRKVAAVHGVIVLVGVVQRGVGEHPLREVNLAGARTMHEDRLEDVRVVHQRADEVVERLRRAEHRVVIKNVLRYGGVEHRAQMHQSGYRLERMRMRKMMVVNKKYVTTAELRGMSRKTAQMRSQRERKNSPGRRVGGLVRVSHS